MADDCVMPPLAASKPPNPGDLRDHQDRAVIDRADPLDNLRLDSAA